MLDKNGSEAQLQTDELIKENRNLKRQLRTLESTAQRNKAMLAARTTVNNMLESEQRKMERNMNLLLENSADIILLFDKDSRFSYFTKTFLKATGLTDTSLIHGNTFSEVFSSLLPPQWFELIQSNITLALEKKSTVTINSSLDLSGGKALREYDIQITPMLDSSEQLEAYMILIHDITDIMQSKTQAESANIAKSQFLATMSHEMRTPMNAVLGMTSIGKAAADPERMLYCFAKIEDASQHLLGVINDILDVSKIEAGKLELSPTDFVFEKMLQRIVNIINFQASAKKQTLHINIDETIPCCLIGDDQRLAQIITNLLGNAVKFTPAGGTITLDTRLVRQQNGVCEIQISVSDTGIGISEEQRQRLFTSFGQADSGISRKFGGTGLGLAISKNIVEMMGGKISVESTLGEGSTFTFAVLLGIANDAAGGKSILGGINHSTLHVLVVDDSEEVLDYFLEQSRRFGFPCEAAVGAAPALTLIDMRGGYDMYFINQKLPDMDGLELHRRIALRGFKEAVYVMMTDQDDGTMQSPARDAGIQKFITKPLSSSSIAGVINDSFGLRVYEAMTDTGDSEDDIFDGRRVLFAEDVEINREILIALLEPTGVELVCAENGVQALEMFSQNPDDFDLILMDMQMPEMDGVEATQRIRALDYERAKTIPIVAMTANVFREDIEACLAAGMNDHLGKPIDMSEVLAKLRKYIN